MYFCFLLYVNSSRKVKLHNILYIFFEINNLKIIIQFLTTLMQKFLQNILKEIPLFTAFKYLQ